MAMAVLEGTAVATPATPLTAVFMASVNTRRAPGDCLDAQVMAMVRATVASAPVNVLVDLESPPALAMVMESLALPLSVVIPA